MCTLTNSLRDRPDNHNTDLDESHSGDRDIHIAFRDTEGSEISIELGMANEIAQTSALKGGDKNIWMGVDNRLLYSKDVVRATQEGSTLVKKINIYDIKDKCSDLCKAISQQQGVYGFLPFVAFA